MLDWRTMGNGLRPGWLCLGVLLLGCGGGSETSQMPPAAPAITGFAATSGTVTSGAATYLTASFTGGTGLVDDDVGLIVSGVPVKVGPLTSDTAFLLTVTGEGGAASRSLTVTVVPAPVTPTIAASSPVTAGGTGYTASVPLQYGTTFAWTIAGGDITQGQGTAEIIYNAGSPGTLQLLCVAVNAAGTRSDPATIAIEALPGAAPTRPPVISRFTAAAATIQRGRSTTLSWSVQGASQLTLSPGGPVTGSSLTVAPEVSTIYTLTATNSAGAELARTEVLVDRWGP